MISDFNDEFLRSGAIFSLEDRSLLVAWGKTHISSELCQTKGPIFYFPDFFLSDPAPWRLYPHWERMSLSGLLAKLHRIKSHHPILKPLSWQPADRKKFQAAFADLKQLFAQRRLYKAIPYLFEENYEILPHGRLLASLLCALQCAQEHPIHLYGFWEEDSQGILGATPEILFRCKMEGKKHCLKTVACAGTQSVGFNENDFLCDPKQCDEHRYVIQGIQESLSTLGENVSIAPTKVVKLRQLLHLVTPLQTDLKPEISFETIVEALHPTPSLGAVPRQEGANWLKDYQQHTPRYRYGAPVGLVFSEEKIWDCLVAIRNVQWHSNWMGIAAGCGIIESSNFNSEWQELCLKIRSIKDILAL